MSEPSAPNNSQNFMGGNANMLSGGNQSLSTMSNIREPANRNNPDVEAPKSFPGKGMKVG